MLRKWRQYSAEKNNSAWFYLLPTLFIVIVFSIYPLISSLIMSFQKVRIQTADFIGLTNYISVLRDADFWLSLKNTALFTVITVPVCLIISFGIALIIHNKVRFKGLFETLFFIPYLTSTIAIGIVFRYMFNKSYGVVNYMLNWIHVGPVDFLDNPKMSIWTLIIFGIWSGLAFNIIILLSGLRSINPDYYKVADMFGASSREQFRKITLPQMRPIVTFLMTVNVISSFKVYTQIYSLFNGKAGIANSATSVVFYIYNKFHVDNRYGVAMAATVILFLIILGITLIQNKLLKKIGA